MAWNPHKFGSIEYDNWNYEHPEDARDPLLEAKQTLRRADEFSKSIEPYAEPQDEQNGFLNERGSVFDSAATRLGRLGRQIARPIPNAARGTAGIGSFLPGPVGAASRLATGAMSGASLAEGGVERLQEHPFLSALDVGGVLAGGSALRGFMGVRSAAKAAPMAAQQGIEMFEDAAKRSGGLPWTPKLSQAQQQEAMLGDLAGYAQRGPSRPSIAALRNEVTGGGGGAAASPVDELMQTESFSRLPKDTTLPRSHHGGPSSTPRARQPDLMDEYQASASGPVGEFVMDGITYRPNASGSHVAGIRSPEITKDLGQALSPMTPSGQPKFGPNAQRTFDRMSGEGAFGSEQRAFTMRKPNPWGEGTPPRSVKPPTAEERLAAKSMERFKKKYRKE